MNLLIRADASVGMGTGHVMRCLALAHAWQDAGGRPVFVMSETTQALRARLGAEGCELQTLSCPAGQADDSTAVIDAAQRQHVDWVVVDGYQFGAEYQAALKAADLKVLFVDDNGHAQHYSADLVLNQNVSATENLYSSRSADTQLLLGTRYCLLRREFVLQSGRKRPVSDTVRTLLVMMGGSDPSNVTARVLEALELAGLAEVETTVVVGGSNPNVKNLEKLAAQSSVRINLQRDVSNLAELMAETDLAISAAGSTCWELCFMGVPSLLIDVADNQTPIARELHRLSCAIHVGNADFGRETLVAELRRVTASSELRRALAHSSRQMVDGQGARRVVGMMRGTGDLSVRDVRPDDKRLLWDWANDPAVRAASFTTQQIPWEDHCSWFAQKLSDRRCTMLVAQDELGNPCGQIRFELRTDGEFEVHISIAKETRGKGLATRVIELGVERIRKEHSVARIHAFVKESNLASVRAFEKAHFRRVGTQLIRGDIAIHLVSEP